MDAAPAAPGYPTDLSDIRAIRADLGISQSAMADLMGMPLRSFQAIEAGENPQRPIHVRAAWWAIMIYAAQNGGRRHLPDFHIDVAQRALAENEKPAS